MSPVVFSAFFTAEECCISLTLQMKRPPAFELWHAVPTKGIFASAAQSAVDDNGGFEVRGQRDRFINRKSSICHGCF